MASTWRWFSIWFFGTVHWFILARASIRGAFGLPSLRAAFHFIFLLVSKRKKRLKTTGAQASTRGLRFLFMEPAKLAHHLDEIYKERKQASQPTYHKETPETLELKTVHFKLRALRNAGTPHEPFVMDPLEIPILRQLQNGRWHVNRQGRVPRKGLSWKGRNTQCQVSTTFEQVMR